MRKAIIVLLCLVFLQNVIFSQESEQSKAKIYKKAKVHLNSGEIFNCRNLTLIDSVLVFTPNDSISQREIPLSDVTGVRVTTKNNLTLGAILGGAIALGTAILINASSDVTTHTTYTTTYTYDESGRHSSTTPPETEVERALPSGTIIAIVAGGSALGGLIGSQIKSGWNKIYPTEKIDIEATLDTLTERRYPSFQYFIVKDHGVIEGKLRQVKKKIIYVQKDKIIYKINKKRLISIFDYQKNNITNEMLNRKNFKSINWNFNWEIIDIN